MLMVGSMRCRSTAQDYRAAYDFFLLHQRPQLGKANLAILAETRARLGAVGALQSLVQASARMANHHGEHAGYSCGDLGAMTTAKADSGSEGLPNAADTLVDEDVALEACPLQITVAQAQERRW